MPRTRSGAATTRSAVAENAFEIKEQVEYTADDDMEEPSEEEVEYEEVEEEVEEEEEIEEVEEVEVEVEDEDDEVDEHGDQEGNESDDDMQNAEEEEKSKKKHTQLLALPPHGSEVYLGGISQDTSEDDLKHFCQSIGEVTEVRIMKGKDSNENRGYAFVTFRSKALAAKAIKDLNNTELKGKWLKCSASQAKNKLFIGNVPRNWRDEDMMKVVNKVGPGVLAVELVKVQDLKRTNHNRGFAFIEYYNHACAEHSRQQMSKPDFKLDDNAPTVSWADTKNAESSSSQVKALYVKNLPKDVTQDQLKGLFEHHGRITKVVLPPAKPGHEMSRYGFVHFAERSSAMKALNNTEKYEIDGQVVECSLARPQADQKTDGGSNSQKSVILPTYPHHPGYGFVGAPYGPLGGAYAAASFPQPLTYGGGAAPGMAMMPMLLPDGRIGYVLQQPGVQPHNPPPQQRSGRSSRGGSSGEKHGSASGRGGHSRYNPY